MADLTFVGISGSLRKASRNTGLLRCCAAHLPAGVRMEIADISALPFYNADLEKPKAAQDLIDLVSGADALVLACPEYNYSLAPALKNALDWLSREPDLAPLNGKAACLLGAGGGMGTSRSQYHLRQVCVYLNLRLLNKPELFSNAFTPAFADNGDVQDQGLSKQAAGLMQALADWTRQLRP
ncbi:NADPH-dependent FMN reductase [Desulfovibrio legallii]|jgi:chromate reductase|uniref:Chromate reductase n=1 Tax=Desulfovibrio legallii TaxID=571438 RepID=A0A1G7ME90_9BACT|nr:NADPH-dependent FMN reductase [Desulfovibrio legallii]SDF59986.1 chromate reductase [Desulfovibrio legallii]